MLNELGNVRGGQPDVKEQSDQNDKMLNLRRMLTELNKPAYPLRTTETTIETCTARGTLAKNSRVISIKSSQAYRKRKRR